MITLTNKSSRVFEVADGRFYPGTSKDFEDKEAIKLLGYGGEIVRAIDALGADSKKVVAGEVKAQVKEKDKEIGDLKGFISKLTTEVTNLKKELVRATARPRGPKK